MKLTLSIISFAGLVAAQNFSASSSSSAAWSSAAASSSAASSSAASSSPPSAASSGAASSVASYATPAASSASSSATPPPQIPSSISAGCSNFLTALNGASGIQKCISPVLDALTSNSTASLSSICSTATSSGCSDSTLRTWLTYFKGNCTNEMLTNPNKDVVALYDVLYVVKPFTGAVCAQDGSGNYCLNNLSGNSTAKAASGITNAAQTPLTSSDGTPDAEAFSNANVMFLGANPSMDATDLCTPCTKNILTGYISWESSTPLANGIANSPLLASQTPLWNAVQTKCPSDFISGTLANAGAAPGAVNGASTSSPAKGAMLMLAIVAAGVMAL
ncbi:hypothetical protein K439DRAFT_1661962 [Ramaria rubella]|nr:hypothetical protein K439DRAFT_1661962 [Ramaria rubella]